MEMTLTYAEAKFNLNTDQREVLRTTSFNFNRNERAVMQMFVRMEAAEKTKFTVSELQQVFIKMASPTRPIGQLVS